jgi:hypothetical protein
MKIGRFVLALAIALSVALAGCAKAEPTPVVEAESGGAGLGQGGVLRGPGGPDGPGGSLRGATGLALGTLKLEGTEHAVTAAQAAELLPLWKMIQGGSLQSQAETDAVLKQIERQIDPAQLTAIEEMGLTFEDIRAWMEETGIEMPTPPAGPGGPDGQGGRGAFQNMTEEERSRLRQEFQNMSPEQRATRMAERGFQRPEGAGAAGGPGRGPGLAGGGAGNLLIDPLIELLTARAAQ